MCTYTRAHAQNGNRHFCHFFKLSPQSIFAAKNVHGVLTIHRRRSFGSSQRPNVDGHLVSVWLSHFSFRLVHPDSPSSPLPPDGFVLSWLTRRSGRAVCLCAPAPGYFSAGHNKFLLEVLAHPQMLALQVSEGNNQLPTRFSQLLLLL